MAKTQEKTEGYRHIGVIGAGSWGTALALAAARAGGRVTVWAREPEVVDSIANRRENTLFLPGVSLPKDIAASGDLAIAARTDALLLVVPAQHLRSTLIELAPHLRRAMPAFLSAKGIELGSG